MPRFHPQRWDFSAPDVSGPSPHSLSEFILLLMHSAWPLQLEISYLSTYTGLFLSPSLDSKLQRVEIVSLLSTQCPQGTHSVRYISGAE